SRGPWPRVAQDESGMAEEINKTAEHISTAFERVQLARHADRPHTLDFIERLFEDFTEIHGDRRYADDSAIVCGFARFHGMPALIVGHQKGRDTKQRQYRNFGMPKFRYRSEEHTSELQSPCNL